MNKTQQCQTTEYRPILSITFKYMDITTTMSERWAQFISSDHAYKASRDNLTPGAEKFVIQLVLINKIQHFFRFPPRQQNFNTK